MGCGREMVHADMTYYGATEDLSAFIAGECCKSRLAYVVGYGVIQDERRLKLTTNPYYRGSANSVDGGSSDALSQAMKAQKALKGLSEMADEMLRKGGAKGKTAHLDVSDTIWKANDRLWFNRYPERTHRSRAPYRGEIDALYGVGSQIANAHQRYIKTIIVRQLSPGNRLRICVLHTAPYERDDDVFLGVVFDYYSKQSGNENRSLSIDGLNELARIADAAHGATSLN